MHHAKPINAQVRTAVLSIACIHVLALIRMPPAGQHMHHCPYAHIAHNVSDVAARKVHRGSCGRHSPLVAADHAHPPTSILLQHVSTGLCLPAKHAGPLRWRSIISWLQPVITIAGAHNCFTTRLPPPNRHRWRSRRSGAHTRASRKQMACTLTAARLRHRAVGESAPPHPSAPPER